ncbi:MAG: hypothetical protein WAT19_01625 [Ferruginibacter sp.]
MKKIVSCFLFAFFGITAFAQSDISFDYIKKSVAITKTAAREISKTEYVVELTLTDYAGTQKLPTGFGLKNAVFVDDGIGNDLKAGDGVYTSKEKFLFKTASRQDLEKNTVYFDESFSYIAKIGTDKSLIGKIKFSCKFTKCGCPCSDGGTCPACTWWGHSCWIISECEIGIEF